MTSLLKLICLLWTFLAAVFLSPASFGAFDGSIAYDAPDQTTITYDACSKPILGYDSPSALAADEKESRTAEADDLLARFAKCVAAKTAAGAGDEMVTVFRGVSGQHPQFQNAIQGRAMPWGGHADAALHNAGNNRSIFTSWSTDYRTSVDFALQDGPGGVVLRQTVPRSSLIRSPDVFGEFEVLRTGPIQGATPIILSP